MNKNSGYSGRDPVGEIEKEERTTRQDNIGLLTIGLLPVIALNTQSWYGGSNAITTLVTSFISALILLMLGIILILANKEKHG
ncbi:MAG: hypothetical protein JW931_07145 [Methanomicrobiaceae archaeon]|nr:hypothetical protein [Methanomicrobiaceae archaeon]